MAESHQRLQGTEGPVSTTEAAENRQLDVTGGAALSQGTQSAGLPWCSVICMAWVGSKPGFLASAPSVTSALGDL